MVGDRHPDCDSGEDYEPCEAVNPETQVECERDRHVDTQHRHGAWFGGRHIWITW